MTIDKLEKEIEIFNQEDLGELEDGKILDPEEAKFHLMEVGLTEDEAEASIDDFLNY